MNSLSCNVKQLLVLAGLLMTTSQAFAFETPNVPEPGLFSLLGVAGVIGIVVAVRRRRK